MDELRERDRKVLKAVVQTYIGKPAPVGSRLLSKKYAFDLSSATIRNIMADLEEMGYLAQPHTSAGRVPTDKGYRFYVDSLRLRPGDERLAALLRRKSEAIRDDLSRFLEEATRTLSSVSHYMAFAIPASPDGTTLNRIQFYRYMGRKTVAVLITNEGLVTSKILDTDFGLTQHELYQVADYLNSEFTGRTIDEIRSSLLREMSKEKAICDILITRAISICREALSFSGNDIIFSGLSKLVGFPELSEIIDDITRAIEDKHRIVSLLEKLAGPGGVKVVIGSENPEEAMRTLSVVTSTYKKGDRLMGTVGMIGPTRMDYSRAMSLVDGMARFISGTIFE
jgi:heat-inducible transcriptional repressor